MPAAAAAGAGQSAPGAAGAAGGNPFQLATNLYCEKNNVGNTVNATVGASQTSGGGQVNAGQYLRGVRLIVRNQAAGATTSTGATINDYPWNLLSQIDFVNVDGSEILYVMGGYAHYLAQKYTRPWLGDPMLYPDAAWSTQQSPQFTLFLQPEIRWTAGCLANTDTRSQYRVDYVVDTLTNITNSGGASYATAPVVNVQPYLDAWAQPDAEDLQGTPNQPVPPGLNLQMKRRHQIFTVNSNSDNIFQSALTGNALRAQILVARNGGTSRAELLTDPILWSIDNRSLGKISVNPEGTLSTTGQQGGDMVQNWMSEMYAEYFPLLTTVGTANAASGGTHTTTYYREPGVYVFPRFLKPGSLYGQGWLYTANSTKEIFEATSTSSASSATLELITDEVYPVGPIDPQLTDI